MKLPQFLLLAFMLVAITPLYFHQMNDNRCLFLEKRLVQDENDLAQAQQDLGELKQQVLLVLRRGAAPD